MKVIQDQSWRAFASAADELGGARIKDIREQPLTPGGRVRLTLFERPVNEDRPHPRMKTDLPAAVDPSPPGALFAPTSPPRDAAGFRAALEAAFDAGRATLAVEDLDASAAPKGSEHFWRNSLRVQRTAKLFSEAEAALKGWLADRTLPSSEAAGARYALRALEADAYAGDIAFDDANTGTYHSFQHDAPFVHYLERILASLPEEDSRGFALLSAEQQESIRRQRQQARNHLDHLMRHKYANEGIAETDIERTLGGFLIDRETRNIASETLASRASLVPAYELIRISPTADHPSAGAWLYREGETVLRTQDGAIVEVDAADLRTVPLEPSKLTFRRAQRDPKLRNGVRFDWDSKGYVAPGRVSWVSWAGHCDIKAIMEGLGLALTDRPSLQEHRSDTGETTTYDRDLLLEMLASVMELGSNYQRLDGSGTMRRGVQRFGGARNDSRPDRLQFQGFGAGKSFRWPLSGGQDAFTVVSIEHDGEQLDPDAVFYRYTADLDAVDFAENPRFLKTVEGDYNLIDVSGTRLEADAMMDHIDPTSGYPVQRKERVVIDLRADVEGRPDRTFLGTSIKDASRRELWRVWLDHKARRVECIPCTHELKDGRWEPRELDQGVVRIPLVTPLSATLSREMRRDDPSMFEALLEVALRQGQNINADTDMKAEVWNGVVTRIRVRKIASNADARVERWRVDVTARFGSAGLDYLIRRDAEGLPMAWCPVPDRQTDARPPDFLWQDFPDVGSKGIERGDWVVNDTMVKRGIVSTRRASWVSGEVYVHDDHIKNLFEMIFCALGGYGWTVVHDNKRYGFQDEASWQAAIDRLAELRDALTWEGDGALVS